MPLECEENAIRHTQRAKNTPPGQQPDLSRRQAQMGGFAESVIVKDIPMNHVPILSRSTSETLAPGERAVRSGYNSGTLYG